MMRRINRRLILLDWGANMKAFPLFLILLMLCGCAGVASNTEVPNATETSALPTANGNAEMTPDASDEQDINTHPPSAEVTDTEESPYVPDTPDVATPPPVASADPPPPMIYITKSNGVEIEFSTDLTELHFGLEFYITDSDMGLFRHMTNLTKLSVNNSEISDIPV